MRTLFAATILAGSLAVLYTAPAQARGLSRDTTGLENIHTLKRVGRKLCMIDHYHYGTGDSKKSKALALKSAKRGWADFVSMEYGSAWARFSLAGSKGAKCTKQGRRGYHCSIEARPCRY